MDERRFTSPSIMRVAQPAPVEARAVAPVVGEAVQADVEPEPQGLEPRVLQFPQFPVVDRQLRQFNLRRPWLRLVNRGRVPRVVEAARAEVVVKVVVPAKVVAVAAVALVAAVRPLPAERVAEALRFRAWRSSTCCWRPA